MKREKILFWTATIIIVLFEGVMPVLTSQTALAKEGIRNLGIPNILETHWLFLKS